MRGVFFNDGKIVTLPNRKVLKLPQEVITAISATIAGCSMLVALVGLIAGLWRNSKKDGSESAALLAEIKADLKYIRTSLDELKNSQAQLEARLGKVENRVAHLEERVEVPIRRIDRLEEQIVTNS